MPRADAENDAVPRGVEEVLERKRNPRVHGNRAKKLFTRGEECGKETSKNYQQRDVFKFVP